MPGPISTYSSQNASGSRQGGRRTEYKVIKLGIDASAIERRIHEAAAKGWQVISFSTEMENGSVVGICLMEREKN
jgi:hypothetical protein